MNIEILKEEYSRKMEKALRRGDFALFDNLRRQYDRLLQTREQVPAKTITDTMSKEDKEKCNRLLRKIPVLADIAESSAVDLLSLLKKYDGTVTLPMLEELRAFNHIARDLRSIIDRVGDESFSISFGDTCDRVNEKIESIYNPQIQISEKSQTKRIEIADSRKTKRPKIDKRTTHNKRHSNALITV